ncbi:MAG: hypothetical protein WCO94_17035, partial [Verrucomicrobiota bacterium]
VSDGMQRATENIRAEEHARKAKTEKRARTASISGAAAADDMLGEPEPSPVSSLPSPISEDIPW